jgi:predicted RNase H-like HicB family nuclease
LHHAVGAFLCRIAAIIVNRWRVEMKLTAVFQKVPEGYIAFVEELTGANTQGATLDEARKNLFEAIKMVVDANRFLSEESLRGREFIKETFDFAAL